MKFNLNKIIIPSSILITPIILATTYSIDNEQNQEQYNKDITNNNLKVVENNLAYNQIPLPNDYKIDISYRNSTVSIPDGIFIPTNKGAILFDYKTSKIKWTYNKATNDNKIYYSIYVPETSKKGHSLGSILVARKSHEMNKHVYLDLDLIDIETGEIFDSVTDTVKLANAKYDSPENLCIISKVQNTANPQYIFAPTGVMNNEKRNENTYLISLKSNGFDKSKGNGKGVEKVSIFERENIRDNLTTLFSMGQISINNEIYSVSLNNYYIWGIYHWYIIVTKMNDVNDKEIALWEVAKGEPYNGSSEMIIPNIKLSNNGTTINFQTVSNLVARPYNPKTKQEEKNRNMIISGSIDVSQKTPEIKNKKLISLVPDWAGNNNPEQNYDIQWGYYSNQLNSFVTYCKAGSGSVAGSVVLFNLDNINEDSNFAPNSKNVKILNVNKSPLYENKNDQWLPMIPYGSSLDNFKKVLILNMSNDKFNNQIIAYDFPLTLKKNEFPISDFNINPETSIDDYKSQINKEWFFKNKNILFINSELIKNSSEIISFSVNKINNTKLQINLNISDNNFSFAITGFGKLFLKIKANDELTAQKLNILQDAEEFYNANKSNWAGWITNNASKLFINPEIIGEKAKITNASATLNGSKIDFTFIFNDNLPQNFSITGFVKKGDLILNRTEFNVTEFKFESNTIEFVANNIDQNWIIANKGILFKNAKSLVDSNQISNLSKKPNPKENLVNISFTIDNDQDINFNIIGFQTEQQNNNTMKILGIILLVIGSVSLVTLIVFSLIFKK